MLMKITDDHIILSESEEISWGEVQRVRAAGNKLGIVLNTGKTIEISNLAPTTVDLAFRTYEDYVRHQKPRR